MTLFIKLLCGILEAHYDTQLLGYVLQFELIITILKETIKLESSTAAHLLIINKNF